MKLSYEQWLQPNNRKIDDKLRNEILKYYKQSRNIPNFLNNLLNRFFYTFKRINVLVEYNYGGNKNLTNQNIESRIKSENIYPLRISLKRINKLFQKEYVSAIYLDERPGSDTYESAKSENYSASVNNFNTDSQIPFEADSSSDSSERTDTSKTMHEDKKKAGSTKPSGGISIKNDPEDSLKLYRLLIPCKATVNESIFLIKDHLKDKSGIKTEKDKSIVHVYFCIKGRKKRPFKNNINT